ncbi:N-acetylgalactosamine 6-sulfate sulfatase (GALNS), partial [Mariniblastus sp.]|nr:N-acetylgalactosamine 6-sulfate sulfatase (GALNS) [Mariniblastus sp.]
GLKVPFLVRWPGTIPAGSVSDHLLYYPDVMPTFAQLTQSECPKTDGLSFLPALSGNKDQKKHKYLYWEYAGQTAVRMNQWKAYKGKKGDWELYDLSSDVEEKIDIAADHPGTLKQLIVHAEEAHKPIKPGEVYDRELTEKDHRQAPHGRNREKH